MDFLPIQQVISNGSSQRERLRQILLPENMPLDDRSMESIIDFAFHYAKWVNYYNLDNEQEGDWCCFFSKDPTILLAVIASIDIDKIEYDYCVLEKKFRNDHDVYDHDDSCEVDPDPANYKALIDYIYGLAVQIYCYCKWLCNLQIKITANTDEPDSMCAVNAGSTDFKTEVLEIIYHVIIKAVINDKIQSALKVLISYDKGSEPPATLDKYQRFIMDDNSGDCTTIWGMDRENYDCILFDNTFDLDKLRALFLIFLQALIKIKALAEYYFQYFLNNSDAHLPHITLFITFLYLFRHAQDHLNTLTREHLLYYYQKVLCLRMKPAQPDQVFIVLKLAKNFQTQLITKGTLLKAGKDAAGIDMVYQLVEDIVVNEATVEQIKTAYIDHTGETGVYAYDVSADKPASWNALGSTNIPPAETGFAIASPLLILNEGQRSLTVELSIDNVPEMDENDLQQILSASLTVQLSSAKGWQAFTGSSNSFNTGRTIGTGNHFGMEVVPDQNDPSKVTVSLYLFMDNKFPAIIAPDINDLSGLGSTYPVMKILINKDHGDTYNFLEQSNLNYATITANVVGVKDIVVQNDQAILDHNKQFQPFGPVPAQYTNFYVGSAEVFSKKLDGIDLDINWAGLPKTITNGAKTSGNDFSFYDHYFTSGNPSYSAQSFNVAVQLLDGRSWKDIGLFNDDTNSFTLFPNDGDENIISLLRTSGPPVIEVASSASQETKDVDYINASRNPEAYDQFTNYDSNLQRGFLRLSLQQDFLHDLFPKAISNWSINDKTAANYPSPPYTPQIASLSLNYSSHISIDLYNNQFVKKDDNGAYVPDNSDEIYENFYHIYPFGYKQLSLNAQKSNRLLPQFEQALPFNIPAHVIAGNSDGNLYIGLSNIVPQENLALLIEVDESSGDYRYDPPNIQWAYLSYNNWKIFSPADIPEDTTKPDPSSEKSLLKSGIIKFSIPEDMNIGNTELDPDLYWIRASAVDDLSENERAVALPDIIEIVAHAVTAEFLDKNNSVVHLSQPLPASTISRFVNTLPAIQKVSQPYASFDGALPETEPYFYRRASERLRHKARAITAWDYEHLALEQYPAISVAKCLDHAKTDDYNRPGFVTLVVVPDLSKISAVNLVTPRAPAYLMEEIQYSLAKQTNLFVSLEDDTGELLYLHVVNPLYEALQVKCKVKFVDGKDKEYYRFVLNNDLKGFLAPWTADNELDIIFGRTIHQSLILNFIEERCYVDKVIDFGVIHYDDGGEVLPPGTDDPELIVPSTYRSVLTSMNRLLAGTDYEHDIEAIDITSPDTCPT